MAIRIESVRSVSSPLSASATEMASMQLPHDFFLRPGSTAARVRSRVIANLLLLVPLM